MPTGPTNPAARAEWTRRRRDAARRHHPDAGGDVDTYLRQMREIDEEFGVRTPHANPFSHSPPANRSLMRRLRGRTRRRTKQAVRRVRQRLPRKLPGSRRYFDL